MASTTTTTTSMSFTARAERTTHPLSRYLLRLMTLKSSNLCLSADVSTTSSLLHLASTLGPHIVVLKTHYDLISNWDYHPVTGTGARLAALARKHGFLIFEDRKFGDIGHTVQAQYTGGTARIIEWANVVNVNMVPGRGVVKALAEAGGRWRERKKCEVRTEIEGGNGEVGADEKQEMVNGEVTADVKDEAPQADEQEPAAAARGLFHPSSHMDSSHITSAPSQERKSSIVSITTLSQSFSRADSPPPPSASDSSNLYPGIEAAPLERGLLILAQMSSEGNFMNAEYTSACVDAARSQKEFVMGFVSQESLNAAGSDDSFISMAPGCQLPPRLDDGSEPAEDTAIQGDGKGQTYNTPRKLVLTKGVDVVIVGRGIYGAEDPVEEAVRYRREAWRAYLERVGK